MFIHNFSSKHDRKTTDCEIFRNRPDELLAFLELNWSVVFVHVSLNCYSFSYSLLAIQNFCSVLLFFHISCPEYSWNRLWMKFVFSSFSVSENISRCWLTINNKTVSVDLLLLISVSYTINFVSFWGLTSHNNLIYAKNVRLQLQSYFVYVIYLLLHLSRASRDVTTNKTLK